MSRNRKNFEACSRFFFFTRSDNDWSNFFYFVRPSSVLAHVIGFKSGSGSRALASSFIPPARGNGSRKKIVLPLLQAPEVFLLRLLPSLYVESLWCPWTVRFPVVLYVSPLQIFSFLCGAFLTCCRGLDALPRYFLLTSWSPKFLSNPN